MAIGDCSFIIRVDYCGQFQGSHWDSDGIQIRTELDSSIGGGRQNRNEEEEEGEEGEGLQCSSPSFSPFLHDRPVEAVPCQPKVSDEGARQN